jgi:hypothetical protein
MANDDLVQQFKKLLEENNKQLRQEIREDTKAEVKAEVDPLHERLDAQREQIANVKTELSEQISRESHDISEIIRDAIIPKLDQHDEEIEQLQKAVGIRPKQ